MSMARTFWIMGWFFGVTWFYMTWISPRQISTADLGWYSLYSFLSMVPAGVFDLLWGRYQKRRARKRHAERVKALIADHGLVSGRTFVAKGGVVFRPADDSEGCDEAALP